MLHFLVSSCDCDSSFFVFPGSASVCGPGRSMCGRRQTVKTQTLNGGLCVMWPETLLLCHRWCGHWSAAKKPTYMWPTPGSERLITEHTSGFTLRQSQTKFYSPYQLLIIHFNVRDQVSVKVFIFQHNFYHRSEPSPTPLIRRNMQCLSEHDRTAVSQFFFFLPIILFL